MVDSHDIQELPETTEKKIITRKPVWDLKPEMQILVIFHNPHHTFHFKEFRLYCDITTVFFLEKNSCMYCLAEATTEVPLSGSMKSMLICSAAGGGIP